MLQTDFLGGGMIQFRDWLRRRVRAESFGYDPTDRFRSNDDLDNAGDYERDTRDLVKTVMTKYRQEFLRFLRHLVEDRGDGELRSLLRRIDTEDRSPDPWKPSHPGDPDEVVAPKADRGAELAGSAL